MTTDFSARTPATPMAIGDLPIDEQASDPEVGRGTSSGDGRAR